MALAVLATVGVVSGGLAIGSRNDAPPPVGGNLGNLWVIASDSPNGTCTRNATPETLAAAQAANRQCNPNDDVTDGVFDIAYTNAANSGDTVCVAAGSYGLQNVKFHSGKTTPATVIEGCEGTDPTVLSVIVGQSNGSTQPHAVTFKDMAITGSACNQAVFVYYGSNGASKVADQATDITFDNVKIAVGKPTCGPVVEIFSSLRVSIINSIIGPACCGNQADGVTTNNSPVGIRFGADTANSYPVNTDPVIRNNLIQGITRNCLDWLTGYGSCPQSTCINTNEACHADAIQIWGTQNLVVDRNRIYHNEINGLFLDSTAMMTDGTVSNNMIGDIIRGATCFDVDGRGIRGVWNIINNTCTIAGGDGYNIAWAKDDPDGIGPGQSMEQGGADWNWKGNIGSIHIAAGVTPTSCDAGTTGVFTFSYNTWSTDNGGHTGCGGNETIGDPTFVNAALAPANTMNLALSGAAGVADNKIPTATCSGFVTTDIDLVTRPQNSGFCDAGAWERLQP